MDFQIQTPLTTIPDGKMWVEVTVPWVQGRIAPNDSAPNFLLQPGDRPTTLYYASIYPATKTVSDDKGQVWYFLDELEAPMYARAEGLRAITAEEITPISPDVEDKLIVVTLNRDLQTLLALENGKEVYYAVISSGGKNTETGNWTTPVGEHPIWRKRIGMRMGGGDLESGFDLVGVGWTCLFSGHGEAIHSTHWHNDFGIPKSHGCVNARPEDAKWLFRWTTPVVDYPLGDKEVTMPGGTRVKIVG
jgi:lipoprotein-anchoring transpeptidase ErfK/SrfK